jgi:hypothetical protein
MKINKSFVVSACWMWYGMFIGKLFPDHSRVETVVVFLVGIAFGSLVFYFNRNRIEWDKENHLTSILAELDSDI